VETVVAVVLSGWASWVTSISTRRVSQHSSDLNTPRLPTFFSSGTFEGSGNLVTLAAGFNAAIMQDRLEFGAVYTTPIAAQSNFDFNGLLVKMVIHY